MSETSVKRNVLTRAETFKVLLWLTNNWEMIKQEQFTQKQAAVRVSKELSLNVDSLKILRIAKDAALDWPPIKRRTSPGGGNKKDRFRMLALWLRSLLQIQDKILVELQAEKLWAGVTPVNRDLLDRIIGGKSVLDELQVGLEEAADTEK